MSARDQMIMFLEVETDYEKRQLRNMSNVELKKLVNIYLAEIEKQHGQKETSI